MIYFQPGSAAIGCNASETVNDSSSKHEELLLKNI